MKSNAKRNRAAVLAALPGRQTGIVKRTGLGQATVSRWLADLHDAGEARIVRWRRTTGKFVAEWARGSGEHAVCNLKPYTSTERRRLARHREDESKLADERDRHKRLQAIGVRRDPLVAALFGEVRP